MKLKKYFYKKKMIKETDEHKTSSTHIMYNYHRGITNNNSVINHHNVFQLLITFRAEFLNKQTLHDSISLTIIIHTTHFKYKYASPAVLEYFKAF